MGTTEHQINVLEAVSNSETLTEAGEKLGISPSSVTRALQRLEENEGKTLLETSLGRTGGSKITRAGKGFLKRKGRDVSK